MSRRNVAVFRVRYSDENERSATMQIAAPLVNHLPDQPLAQTELLALRIENMRIGTMLPISNVVYRGMIGALPISPDCELQPLDSPIFLRDVTTTIEALSGCAGFSYLMRKQLTAELLAPRLYVHTYTYDSDRRFRRDIVSEKVFDMLIKMYTRPVSQIVLNDIATAT